ncbi:hypothetical protein D3C83_108940 [compost metagenome]
MSVSAAMKAIHGSARQAARITMNSPTKPEVAGRPALAIANSTMRVAKCGIVLTTPP